MSVAVTLALSWPQYAKTVLVIAGWAMVVWLFFRWDEARVRRQQPPMIRRFRDRYDSWLTRHYGDPVTEADYADLPLHVRVSEQVADGELEGRIDWDVPADIDVGDGR